MNRAPWSEIGRLQQDIQSLKQELHRKPDNHELSTINSKMDSMERTVRELSTSLDDILFRVRQLEEDKGSVHLQHVQK